MNFSYKLKNKSFKIEILKNMLQTREELKFSNYKQKIGKSFQCGRIGIFLILVHYKFINYKAINKNSKDKN